MKNYIKLSVLSLVLSVSIMACGDGDKGKEHKPDSVATATKTTVADSLKKDSAGNVTSVKKDSVTSKKTETKKM